MKAILLGAHGSDPSLQSTIRTGTTFVSIAVVVFEEGAFPTNDRLYCVALSVKVVDHVGNLAGVVASFGLTARGDFDATMDFF